MRRLIPFAAALLLSAGCYYPAYVPPTQAQGVTTQPGSGQEIVLSGGEGTEVVAEGVAAVTSTVDIARDHALRDALRKAVEQGVGTLVSSETRVQNFQLLSDKVYSQAQGYVSSYRVLTESREGETYRVVVRAKVKLDKIEGDLGAIGILISEQGRPRVMVVVKELDNQDDWNVDDRMMSQELTETMIVDAFQSKGFPVVDAATVKQNLERDQLKKILAGDNQAAVLLGLKTGAEVVVAGTAQRSSERKQVPYSGTTADFYKVKLSVRAVNTASAEIIGSSALVREVPFNADNARQQAADSASAELVAKILRGWKKHENITQIHAENADYAKVQQLKSEIMSKVRGVVSVISRDLTGTDALLEVVSQSSSQEILDDLGTRKLAVQFDIKGFTGNRIDIRFADGNAEPKSGGK